MTTEETDIRKTLETEADAVAEQETIAEAVTAAETEEQTTRETIAGEAALLDVSAESSVESASPETESDLSQTINLTLADVNAAQAATLSAEGAEAAGTSETLKKTAVDAKTLVNSEGPDAEALAEAEAAAAEKGEADSEKAEDGAEGGDSEDKKEEEKAEEQEVDPEIEAIKEKIRERKREKKRKARRRKIRFWTVLTILVVTIGGFLFSISGFFTVDSIEVNGNQRFSDEEIINIAHAVPGHNLLYNSDSKEIIEFLEQNPYIKSASVERKLPSTLVITVSERAQACAFKYDDDYLIMDNEGILLNKTRTAPKTTMVTGLVVTKIRLGDVVGTENQQMFSKLMKLIRATEKADLYFVSIDMTGYPGNQAVKAYIYDKLVVKSSYDALMEFLDNGRLHRVVEKLFAEDTKRGTILLGDDGSASFEPGI